VKIFGIGLSKTGTTSLANALEILEFKVKDCIGVTQYVKNDISSIDANIIEHNDAFTDTPIPSFYKELDNNYPGSKFILTIRDTEGWLKSCKNQFNQRLAEKRPDAANQLFLDLYDTIIFDEEKFKHSYKKFTDDALEYFKDRPNDLLVINVSKGEGWEKLCPFLNKPTPEALFPKSNVTQIKWLNVHDLAQNVRNSAFNLQQIYKEDEKNFKSKLYALVGINKEKRIQRAAEKTEQLLIEVLSKLNKEIPVISKNNQNIPTETRNDWHHFWLIDCSTNNNSHNYVINIALIENGAPYIGLIYIPINDIIYYSAIDKGAFQSLKTAPPLTITSSDFTLEQLIESLNLVSIVSKQSNEWHTAAGHAIIKFLGFNLVEVTNNQTLKYNKTDWKNPTVQIVK